MTTRHPDEPDAFEQAQATVDTGAAVDVVEDLLDAGAEVGTVLVEVIAQTQHRIGQAQHRIGLHDRPLASALLTDHRRAADHLPSGENTSR